VEVELRAAGAGFGSGFAGFADEPQALSASAAQATAAASWRAQHGGHDTRLDPEALGVGGAALGQDGRPP